MSTLLERLQATSGNEIAAIIAFVLTFGVFIIATWRAFRMKPEKKEHLASLPLEDEDHHNKIDPVPEDPDPEDPATEDREHKQPR